MSERFDFREFTINQDRCGMKVGTDSVLLGAWANKPCSDVLSVLDIGAGTGILSLMMAQIFPGAEVKGIEIDHSAFLQASDNVNASKYRGRIEILEGDFMDFGLGTKFDIIISNPPFFGEDRKVRDALADDCGMGRYTARHVDSLPFGGLAGRVKSLLSERGLFSVIIPYDSALCFIGLCAENGLYLTHRCDVKDSPKKEFKRSLMTFSHEIRQTESSFLSVRDEGGEYSSEFRRLTSSFYLPTA